MKTNEVENQQRFILLRAEGRTFAHIAEELQVSKPTLINWSRKFHSEIQNQRAIFAESLKEKWLATRQERVASLGEYLHKIEAELSKRDLTALSTGQLFHFAAALRREIQKETGPLEFTAPVAQIPEGELNDQVQCWSP